MPNTPTSDAIVVGGGLAGLTAAVYLTRAGRHVTLFEKARTVGGRALTQSKGEFHFNIGPHALYRDGAAMRAFDELGIAYHGGTPSASGGYAVADGAKHALPGGLISLLTTGLLRLPEKFEVARALATIQKWPAAESQRVSLREWLDRSFRAPRVRQLIEALTRLATYANCPTQHSAGTAIAQLQLALAKNVLYVDGGWQTLVDGLRAVAAGAGVQISEGSRVSAIEHTDHVAAVRLADGARLPAHTVIIAASPGDAASLVADGPAAVTVNAWARDALPIEATCLDIGLRHLPQPRATFALGIDCPLYLSVHSAVAKLAPAGGATIHAAKYLDPTVANDAKASERELETLLDLIQPGWRDLVVERRFLPSMTVYHGLVTAAQGGMQGRPGPAVPGVRNLFVAGDWVGPQGLLADASVASAKRAAEMAAQGEPSLRAAAA